MGIIPDLMEGLPQEEKTKLLEEQRLSDGKKQKLKQATSIDERFESAILREPNYATKTIGSIDIPGINPLDLLGRK